MHPAHQYLSGIAGLLWILWSSSRNKNYQIVLRFFWQSGVRTSSKTSLPTSWGRFWTRYLRGWRPRIEASLRTGDGNIFTIPFRKSWLEPHLKYQCTKHTACNTYSKEKISAQLYGCGVIKIREMWQHNSSALKCCTGSNWDRVNFLHNSLSGAMFQICD